MIPKVREAQYKGDYRIWLKFSDGVEGEIDLGGELSGDIFEPLKELTVFSQFTVSNDLETIVWPNGADFAPEFLYQKLRPHYTPKPTPKSGAT